MGKALDNVTDITHVKPLSRIHMLQWHKCSVSFCWREYILYWTPARSVF